MSESLPDFEAMRTKDLELAKMVYITEGHVVINVHYEYNIPLDACRTYESIVGWILQLSEKTWMTTELTRRFIYIVCRENGLKIPH